jgi:small subunit ribosomal protein S8
MSVNHLVSFFIASMKNAGQVKKETMEFSYSKVIEGICKVLVQEGFIKSYEVFEEKKNIKKVRVFLSYYKKAFVIKDFSVVSTPGLRSYTNIKEMRPFYDGLGTLILSTNKGIITDKTAKELKAGGEILCKIF